MGFDGESENPASAMDGAIPTANMAPENESELEVVISTTSLYPPFIESSIFQSAWHFDWFGVPVDSTIDLGYAGESGYRTDCHLIRLTCQA